MILTLHKSKNQVKLKGNSIVENSEIKWYIKISQLDPKLKSGNDPSMSVY